MRLVVCFIIVFFLNLVSIVISWIFKIPAIDIRVAQLPRRKGKEFYLISGILNQASEAFGFMNSLIDSEDGIFFLDYNNSAGFNVRRCVEEISKRLESRPYLNQDGMRRSRVIISISVGDQIARELVRQGIMDEIYSINPCTFPWYLKPKVKALLTIVAPGMRVLRVCLGIFADIPIIPSSNQIYSLKLVADQLWAIRFAPNVLRIGNHLASRRVILSQQDEFLNNPVIARHYDEFEMTLVDCPHARTSGEYADLYRQAMKELMRKV